MPGRKRAFNRSVACGLVTASAVLFLAEPVGAEIYKWVDEKGVVNYSESPPPKGHARLIEPEDPAASVYAAPAVRESVSVEHQLKNRVNELEQILARERQAQDDAVRLEAERVAQSLERCRQDRRVDCEDDPWGVDYPIVINAQPPHGHLRPKPQSRPARLQPQYLKSVEPARSR